MTALAAMPKRLPAKYFYDEAGSRLFERITELPEYYPTRTEMRILESSAESIAQFAQPGAALVEFGSGSTAKARLLLRHMASVRAYVPVDISAEFVNGEAARLQAAFPDPPSAISSPMKSPGFCAAPDACWDAPQHSWWASTWSRTRRCSTPPITTRKASRRISIATCWCASIASSPAIST